MATRCGTWEHDWPGELDSDATCAICGLAYSQWSDEEFVMDSGPPDCCA